MKGLKKILLTGLVLLMIVGCGESNKQNGAKDKEDIQIAAIYRDMTQTWFIQEADAATEMTKELGIKTLKVGDGKEDASVYVDVLDNLLSQGIDGLIVNILDQKLSQMTVDKAKEAGIPILAVDVPLVDEDGNYLAPAIELNGYLVGTQMAEWVSSYMDENSIELDQNKTGVMLLAMERSSSVVPRSDGQFDSFVDMHPDFPKANIIRVDYNSGSVDDGFNAASATIAANPHFTNWIVMAANDEGALGATRALEQQGLDENAIVVGIGGYHAKDEFRKGNSAFIASSYIQASTVGRESVKAVYEYIVNGTPIFEEYKTDKAFGIYPFGGIMVTKDNFEEVMGDDAK